VSQEYSTKRKRKECNNKSLPGLDKALNRTYSESPTPTISL
jgi:hypothetical protein